MFKFILKKTFEMVPTLIGISLFSFILIRLAPGDPLQVMMGERGYDAETYQQMKESLGLDKSLMEQYATFLSQALHGNLGLSIISRHSVANEFFSRWPATLELGISALFLATLIGIPIGIICALKRGSPVDRCLSTLSLVGYSMPVFWWGMILILVFSILFGLTPVAGRIDVLYDVNPWSGFLLIDCLHPRSLQEYGLAAWLSAVRHLILPSVVMATAPLAVFAKTTRASMLEVLSEDYIRTGKAKGLSRWNLICGHALRNALIPIITVGGILFISTVVTGAVLTETLFSWPGVGSYIVAGVNARDYPVIQGSVVVLGFVIVLINAAIEVIYHWANPRLRAELA